jgi:tripartite-type tricarboxylate transporter receptor subunit TctC
MKGCFSMQLKYSVPAFWIAILISLTVHLDPLFAQPDFYRGKTITIIQGRDPGGSGDLRAKAMIPFLQKHIPGNPTVISEYMPGGGGRKAANHVFRSARPDGLTIGNAGSSMVQLELLGESGVMYNIDKFFYLGSPYSVYHPVFFSRKQAGLDSLAKLRAASGIRVGGQSVGFSSYIEGRLFSYVLGLKDPKFVTGYGGAELDPALLRGEIDARSSGADGIMLTPEWLKGGVVDFHTIINIPKGEKHPQFSHLPELESLARSDKDRKLIILQRGFRVAGAPSFLPPGTPKERVEILQEAFRKTYTDPEFHKEYKKLTGPEPTPLLPKDHEKVIKEIPREPEVIELFKKIAGGDSLPPN